MDGPQRGSSCAIEGSMFANRGPMTPPMCGITVRFSFEPSSRSISRSRRRETSWDALPCIGMAHAKEPLASVELQISREEKLKFWPRPAATSWKVTFRPIMWSFASPVSLLRLLLVADSCPALDLAATVFAACATVFLYMYHRVLGRFRGRLLRCLRLSEAGSASLLCIKKPKESSDFRSPLALVTTLLTVRLPSSCSSLRSGRTTVLLRIV
mmetsp:Transcript_68067/g.154007  ORF Transcript_68067/g.154007 Transcript_68067/m.154007 type:complete len:212 (-) Transcript_68067:848-1483(-)